MAIWRDDVVKALQMVGGIGHLNDIYIAIKGIRPKPHPKSLEAIVRRELEHNSSDTTSFKNNHDLFYSVKGLGSGIWGLRVIENISPEAIDLKESKNPLRSPSFTYRILRDTRLARQLKELHNHECQICGSTILLTNNKRYSEAHHIKPLGASHNGPDIAENILVLCPNHHAMCDYAAINLKIDELRTHVGHKIGDQFIAYHNELSAKCGESSRS